jgi:hypothetical protein
VPAESRWHPPPATADADSCGEQVPVPEVMKVYEVVPEVMKVMKVSKVSEVVAWKVCGVTERMYAPRSAGHAKTVHAAEAVHAAHAAHRLGGQCRWRDKHRYHDRASNRDFAEHDNPPGRHPRIMVSVQCKMFK